MKYSKIIGLTIVSSTALLTACTDDLANIFNSEHEIVFEVKTTSANDTRATDSIPEIEPVKLTADNGETYYLHTDITPMSESIQPADTSAAVTRGVTADATSLHNGFGVSAYNTDGTTEGISYFLNSSTSYTTVSTTDVYTPTGAGSGKYWPKGKLNFYAYYPYTSAVTGTDSEDTHGLSRSTDGKTIKYVVPSTPANQPDLMTAKLENQQYSSGDGRAALTFNHALCAISFKTGTDIAGGTIKSITFNNVYTEGKYDISTGTWSDAFAGNLSFTGLSKSTTEGTSGTLILTDDNTLMMIPQDFTSDNQTITISFAVSGEATPKTLTYNLNGSSWTKGQSITYSITTDGLVWAYVLEATGGEIDYTGGNVTFNVKSYRYKRTTPSTIEALPWTVDGYKADGASTFSSSKPSWITSITTSGDGTATTSATNSGTATITAQTATTAAASFTSVERGTSNAPYDLSTKGGTTSCNTANCYVVNAPGWYKIPLVYGNGIKNGVNNTSAYNSSTFVDINNKTILSYNATASYKKGPYIKNSGTPGSAVLTWQDANGLITSVSYDSSNDGYIKFYIPYTGLKEGNAVVSIKNTGGVVMWSWHIWATAADIDSTIPVTTYETSHTYNFMPVNLGWVSLANSTFYAARSLTIKLSQTGSAASTTLNVSQNQKWTPSNTGYSPFYEYGRNIPMMSWSGSGTTLRTYYSINGSNVSFTITGGVSDWTASNNNIAKINAIKNPSTYYVYPWNPGAKDICDVGHDTYYSTISVCPYSTNVKSVYDPCPVGFKVPYAYAFSGFMYNGGAEGSPSISNTRGTSDWETGWNLYTTNSKTNSIYFPHCGLLDCRDGTLQRSTTCYWTSCRSSDEGVVNMSLSNNGTATSRASVSYGFCIRPIAE